MNEQMVVYLFREAFYTMILVSSPMLTLSLIIGLIIAIFQAATSIQEVTLTFVPKIIIVAVVAVLTLPWMMPRNEKRVTCKFLRACITSIILIRKAIFTYPWD